MNQTKSSVGAVEAVMLNYENWRETFLRLVLRSASLVGIIVVAFTLSRAAPAMAALYALIYIFLLAITFAPLPYSIRAGGLAFIIYLVGLVVLAVWGISANASLYLAAFIVMTALLFDWRGTIAAAALTAITILLIGWLSITGNNTFALPRSEARTWGDWFSHLLNVLTVSAVISAAIYLVKREFGRVLQQMQQTFDALRAERETLEERVRERTRGLIRKTEQLRAASTVARQTAAQQDLHQLLNSAVDSITSQFGYYHAAIYLLNQRKDHAAIQAASSEGGKQMVRDNFSVNLGESHPIAQTAKQQKPQIALGSDIFKDPNLPESRSRFCVPIVLRGETVGVLDIQSTAEAGLSMDEADVFQSLADHIAIAIENARLLNETQTVLMQLESVNISQTRDAWSERYREKPQAYTYTDLGLRPTKPSDDDPNAVKVPIILRGHQIGIIALARKEGETWNEHNQALVEKVAGQVSLAIDNLRLLEEAQKSALRDQTLASVSNRLRETLDMESILQSAAREFQRTLNLKDVEIRLGLPETSEQPGVEARKVQTGILRKPPERKQTKSQ